MVTGLHGIPGWVRSTVCDAARGRGRPHMPMSSASRECIFCKEKVYRISNTAWFTQRRFVIYEEPF